MAHTHRRTVSVPPWLAAAFATALVAVDGCGAIRVARAAAWPPDAAHEQRCVAAEPAPRTASAPRADHAG
jgi:hypothetical protein